MKKAVPSFVVPHKHPLPAQVVVDKPSLHVIKKSDASNKCKTGGKKKEKPEKKTRKRK